MPPSTKKKAAKGIPASAAAAKAGKKGVAAKASLRTARRVHEVHVAVPRGTDEVIVRITLVDYVPRALMGERSPEEDWGDPPDP